MVAASILALAVLGCSYAALSPNSYYYQVTVGSSENLDEVELYVPLPEVAGKPHAALLGYRYYLPRGGMTQDYIAELFDTEYGPMFKFVIRGLQYQRHPEFPYRANIILWQRNSFSWDIMRLSPKSDVTPLQVTELPHTFGPIITHQSKRIERFNVPIMVRAKGLAEVEVTLRNRTDRGSAIGFAFGKSDPYTEHLKYRGNTGSSWASVPVEAGTVLDIRGAGD